MEFRSSVPELRVRPAGSGSVHTQGDWVLYWMVANRRSGWNFSLQRAVEWARHLGRPLVVFEELRAGYPWVADRFHQFVIEGMRDNQVAFAGSGVEYYPYLEPWAGAGQGALAALARRSCVVVSDDFPCFFLPRMLAAASAQIPVRFELVDSNGIYPMRAADRVFIRAYDFRRHLQKFLKPWLTQFPAPDPLRGSRLATFSESAWLADFERNWPRADLDQVQLSGFPIDHSVSPLKIRGGSRAATAALDRFVSTSLANYSELRNHPDCDVSSGLSGYLHFGHLSAHQIFDRLAEEANWSVGLLADKKVTGRATGWWGASPNIEAYLDQLITWRELGFNACVGMSHFDRYESLPAWARATLEAHAHDRRTNIYSLSQFEAADTHDPLWNAAQRQLRREGRIHNYLRMLWGKKILEWTASPEEALPILIELNNKYAIDGRNPNSYSGIMWILGRYDRPWGPERSVFGTVRYMSSENTARKVKLRKYLERFAP